MKKAPKKKLLPLIGIRVTPAELKQVKLIMKTRRINSYSHTLRVLIAEEAEKILATPTS